MSSAEPERRSMAFPLLATALVCLAAAAGWSVLGPAPSDPPPAAPTSRGAEIWDGEAWVPLR